MAFTFIEPFEEGDIQKNLDTGVEYIYHDGAWRALGPKIEDQFDTLDDRYVNKTGDKMTGTLDFGDTTNTTKDFIRFLNNKKANQVSILKVNRPYSADDGVNSDGAGGANGVGGFDIKLMNNSDSNRLRILTGSSAATETLRITAGGNGRQIHAFSSIGLAGGSDAKQTIWAENGIAGHLSYNGVDETHRRLSWGASKVWIRRECDLTGNKIIGLADPDPDRGQDAANVDFVNEQIAGALDGAEFDNYVEKTGDEMTGDLKIKNGKNLSFHTTGNVESSLIWASGSESRLIAKAGYAFKLQAQDTSNNSRTFIDFKNANSSGTQGSDSGYRIKIYHLADPTSDYHAANQKYVKAQDQLRVEGRFKITSAGGNYYIEPN